MLRTIQRSSGGLNTFFSHSIFLAVVVRPRQQPRQGRVPSDNSLFFSNLSIFFADHSLRRCCWRGRTTTAGGWFLRKITIACVTPVNKQT